MARNVTSRTDVLKISLYLNARIFEFNGKTFDAVKKCVAKEFPEVADSTLRKIAKDVGIVLKRPTGFNVACSDRVRTVARSLAIFLESFMEGEELPREEMVKMIRNLRTLSRGGKLDQNNSE